MANEEKGPFPEQPPTPPAAMQRLEKLVGRWKLTGRPIGAQQDDVEGWAVFEWFPGGFFMEQRGEITFMGGTAQSMEIVGYDPATDTFPSTVYSSMDGTPLQYAWDVQGNVVTHWTKGAKYTGTFNEDFSVLEGGWRPEEGEEPNPGNNYDATMIRLQDE